VRAHARTRDHRAIARCRADFNPRYCFSRVSISSFFLFSSIFLLDFPSVRKCKRETEITGAYYLSRDTGDQEARVMRGSG
jgi:hypothetical protein